MVNSQTNSKNAAWADYITGIKRVDFKDKIAPTSIDGWFYGMTQLKNSGLLHLENLDTSSCKYMRWTFAQSGIDTLDLRSFDVSKVVAAYATFFSCTQLTSLDISTWDLPMVGSDNSGKIDNSGNLESFLQNTALETIDLSSLNLQYSLNLQSMLKGNTKLKNVIFGDKFIVGQSTTQHLNMKNMFEGCTALETLDLSSWDIYNIQNCEKMFSNCSSLTDINFGRGKWRPVSGNAVYPSTFEGCTSLVTLKRIQH